MQFYFQFQVNVYFRVLASCGLLQAYLPEDLLKFDIDVFTILIENLSDN